MSQDKAVVARLVERLTLQKFDKTDVLEPGVEGLKPFETIDAEYVYDAKTGVLLSSRVERKVAEGTPNQCR